MNIFCRAIKVDVASHSPQVDVLRDDLLRALAPVRPRAATMPIYSTVTSAVADGSEFDAEYWARNLRQPVLLSATVERLAGDGNTTFIEMSPHPILLPAIETGLAALGLSGAVMPSLRRDEDEREGCAPFPRPRPPCLRLHLSFAVAFALAFRAPRVPRPVERMK